MSLSRENMIDIARKIFFDVIVDDECIYETYIGYPEHFSLEFKLDYRDVRMFYTFGSINVTESVGGFIVNYTVFHDIKELLKFEDALILRKIYLHNICSKYYANSLQALENCEYYACACFEKFDFIMLNDLKTKVSLVYDIFNFDYYELYETNVDTLVKRKIRRLDLTGKVVYAC